MEIMEIIQYLNNIFWGWLVAGLLLCTGIYLTCRLHFPQIRYFTRLFSNLKASLHSNENESGSISGFAALCSALGGQVGTGCFVGVATAIASGGPGAVFWMWMTALLACLSALPKRPWPSSSGKRIPMVRIAVVRPIIWKKVCTVTSCPYCFL